MKKAVNLRVVARQPQQQRGHDRVEQVLAEAEAMLRDGGIETFSIPALAERLGFTRTSIYKFFPTPYAILNTLAERHLAALEASLVAQAASLHLPCWEDSVAMIVRSAASWYDRHPVACKLILGGPVSDASYRAFEFTITRLGGLARGILVAHGVTVPDGPPDLPALAVDFGTGCFRMSYFLHGRITKPYVQAAEDVMLTFLRSRLVPAAKPRRRDSAGTRVHPTTRQA
jgi:AcrR family transcriptional regulator